MTVRLPKLVAGDLSWRLPLSDVGAAVLVSSLLADDAADCTQRLTGLLALEPGLALWVAARAFPEDAPSGLAALAGWLTARGAAELRWDDPAQPDPAQPDPAQPDPAQPDEAESGADASWSRLAEISVCRAQAAEALAAERCEPGAGDDAECAPQRAYLFALLQQPVDWLRSSGSGISWTDCRAGRSCLPRWLIRFLADLKSSQPQPLVTLVSQAGFDSESAQRGAEMDAVSRRWRAPDEFELAARLPQILTKLAVWQQLESQFAQQLEDEKLASLYWLAYGASHEINNPLANISTRAQSLLRDETDPERKRMLATINSQAFRAHEMINDLMLFANPPDMSPSKVDAEQLLREAIDEMQPSAGEQGTQICGQWQGGPHWIQVDREQLVVALQALLKNSLEALGAGGRIEVTADWSDRSSAARDAIEIVVADDGPGIPPEIRRHLFDPFFSGREAGRGLGLGLSKCWRIVKLHGGRIDVTAGQRGGTAVRIELPRTQAPDPGSPAADSSSEVCP